MEIFTDSFRVRISDSDSRGYLRMPALLGMFQEVARDHAELRGIGSTLLEPQDLGWALSKMLICVDRLPRCGERLTIRTWPSTRNKIFTEREFLVFDESGAQIISARSLWVLFDLKKRRLERLDKLPDWPRLEEFANSEKFGDMSPPLAGEIFETSFSVRKDDLDINGHVNNPLYLTWALEPLADDFYNAHLPKRVELWFLSEVFRSDTPEASCSVCGNISAHKIFADGKDRARAVVEWINA